MTRQGERGVMVSCGVLGSNGEGFFFAGGRGNVLGLDRGYFNVLKSR